MSQSRIRALLETRLNDWADNRSPVIDVVWQNVRTSEEDTYIQSYLIPAPTTSDDLKGDHMGYSGVFQASIITPPLISAIPAEGIAEELQALFPTNLRLTDSGFTVQLTTPMSIGPEKQEPNKFILPVSAQYRADDI